MWVVGAVTEAAWGLAGGQPQAQEGTAPPQLLGQPWGKRGMGLGRGREGTKKG